MCIFILNKSNQIKDGEQKWKSENASMTSETLQNPYFVRLFCIWILTKHISNYNIVKNRSLDKIKILWALKFQKKGGRDHFEKGGGGLME